MSGAGTDSRTPRPTNSRIYRKPKGFGTLPLELATQVLKYLPIACLRRASGVSRALYASAWDAGLYIHRCIIWCRWSPPTEELVIFEELLQHALTKNLRLSLTAICQPSFATESSAESAEDDDTRFMCAVMTAITSALPLLVYLSLTVDDSYQVVTAALGHPAPRLREFDLSLSLSDLSEGLSHDFFAGHAPLLSKLALYHVPIGTIPVRAFSRITSLRLACTAPFPDISFVREFPRLTDLTLAAVSPRPMELSQNFSLTGVTLHSLSFGEAISMSSLWRVVDVDKVPNVRFRCGQISWIEPANDDADFSLRLAKGTDPDQEETGFVTVVPYHRRWRRMYDVLLLFTLPITDKPGGPAHLTYLRLDNIFLHDFLSCNTAFHAMRSMQVDFTSEYNDTATVWPPDAPDYDFGMAFDPKHKTAPSFDGASLYNVPCSALRKLTLFALDTTMAVNSLEAAFLGRALGQLVRPKHEKAALALVGVEFSATEAHALVDQTFSAVETYAFAGLNSKEDHDDGLWDDGR